MNNNLIDIKSNQRCYPQYDPIKEEENFRYDIGKLIEEGFDEKVIMKVYVYLKPNSIEEIKEYLTLEEGKYKHKFISNRKDINNCVKCNKGEEKHFNYRGDKIITNENELIGVNNDIINDNRHCMVCSNELKDSEIAKNQLKCGHLYCDLCLQTYIDSRIKKIKIPYLLKAEDISSQILN